MDMVNGIKNYLSTMGFVWFVYWFYNHVGYYISFFDRVFTIYKRDISFHTKDIFFWLVVFYAIFLMIYYTLYSDKSTAREVMGYIVSQFSKNKKKFDDRTKQAFLKIGVKFFYAPLMIFWFTGHVVTLINNIYFILGDAGLATTDFVLFFNKHLFWNLFNIILTIDVFFFTIGYLTERDKLGNTIRSAQPYAVWWIVALMCYPPFNNLTSGVLNWYSTDFPQFAQGRLTVTIWFIICILMSIYTWASISLGWKASNLTNRGIVYKWPYKYIRHPAYITKNIAWLLGAVPMALWFIHSQDWKSLFYLVLSLLGRGLIYHARSVTEEMHLSLDPDYVDYKKKVPYKYIPWLY